MEAAPEQEKPEPPKSLNCNWRTIMSILTIEERTLLKSLDCRDKTQAGYAARPCLSDLRCSGRH